MKRTIAMLLNSAIQGSSERFQNRAHPQRLPGARFEIKNAADADTSELYIYGDVGWYDITASMVAETLNAITAKTLVVHVNSMGGEVFEGVAIHNLLRDYAKKNGARIVVRVDALAASIASVISMAGDDIVMAKNALMMIHRASGGCWGDAEDMLAMAQVLETLEASMIVPSYRSHSKLSVDELLELMKAETWMNADDAVKYGFATQIGDDTGTEALLRPGMFAKAPKITNAADWVCPAARDLPITKSDTWNGPAAAERIFEWAGFNGDTPDPAKAKKGFLAQDAADPKLKGSYKLPFADVIGDVLHAVDKGWVAAETRLDATDIPEAVKTEARAVIEAYEKKAGEDDDEDAENRARIARIRMRNIALSVETA